MEKKIKFANKLFAILIMSLFLMFASAGTIHGQTVMHNGLSFIAIPKEHKSQPQKTPLTYTDTKGVTYEVYVSNPIGGKYFIYKTSKKGNVYKYYFPKKVQFEMDKEYSLYKNKNTK